MLPHVQLRRTLIFLMLASGPGPAAIAQDATGAGAAPAAAQPAEQAPAPADTPAEAAPDANATGTGAGSAAAPSETAPEPATPAAPAAEAPRATPVPAAAVEPVEQEDRIRSTIIRAAEFVLLVAVAAIVVLAVRRGRELRTAAQPYVAEAYLNDLQGATAQTRYQLGSKPVMLGRVAGRDTEHIDYIVIPQSTIGRRHALIEYKDYAYWIMDQGSINGTFVNDKPVSAEIRLKHGDRVRLHKYQFEFVMPDVGEAGRTVIAEAGASGRAPAPVETHAASSGADAEMFLDLSVGETSAPARVQPAAGSGRAPSRAPAGRSEDETLMPGASPDAGESASSDDETLLPGGASVADENSASASEDETLMPGMTPPPSAARDAKPKAGSSESGDEFFDITGSARDERK